MGLNKNPFTARTINDDDIALTTRNPMLDDSEAVPALDY